MQALTFSQIRLKSFPVMSQKRSPRRLGTDPRPTLADVARQAGVSTATVSRCLNSPDRVVEDTRARVLAVVRDLGYAPNFGARALAGQRTSTIGAIIPTMENAIFARGLQAFQEALAGHGLTLLVASSSYSPELEEEQIKTLLARGADALFLIGYERPATTYAQLARRKVPYVVAWAHREGEVPLSVGFDNKAAMFAMAARVFALGHREVAMICAPVASNDRAAERVRGVLDAAEAAGVARHAVRVIELPYSIENGARAMTSLMSKPAPPTAVICGNDVLAVGAVRAARALGLDVPGDVSVTGFDNIELAEIVDPPLTTVSVPHRAMGQEAARVIVDLLSGARDIGNVRLETEIVEGGSLGPRP